MTKINGKFIVVYFDLGSDDFVRSGEILRIPNQKAPRFHWSTRQDVRRPAFYGSLQREMTLFYILAKIAKYR